MIRQFKIYWTFSANQIKSNFVYKGRFYFYILKKFLGMFIYYYLWMAIYASAFSDKIGGYTQNEMIIYIFMSYTISDIIMIDISTEIGNDVVEGNVAINLIKPISYRMSLVFKAFGLMIYRLVIPSLFIWIILEIYKVAKLGMDVSNLFTIISFMLSLVLSFLIYIFFDYCFGMLAFVTTYIFGMNIIKNALLNFLTGKLIPISFFPLFIQKVFAFLPFVSMTYVPVLIYMGKYSKIEVLVQLGKQTLWVIILYWFGYFLWNKVQRKMVILGG